MTREKERARSSMESRLRAVLMAYVCDGPNRAVIIQQSSIQCLNSDPILIKEFHTWWYSHQNNHCLRCFVDASLFSRRCIVHTGRDNGSLPMLQRCYMIACYLIHPSSSLAFLAVKVTHVLAYNFLDDFALCLQDKSRLSIDQDILCLTASKQSCIVQIATVLLRTTSERSKSALCDSMTFMLVSFNNTNTACSLWVMNGACFVV